MDRRKILAFSIQVAGIFGLIMLAVPFVGSMFPSAKAIAEREAWNNPPVPDMSYGQVITRQMETSKRREYPNGSWSPVFGKRDILIRDYNGNYYSYRLPTWKGEVVMPRVAWGQWEAGCNNFGPTIVDGVLSQDSPTIQCNDPGVGAWAPMDARWSIDGISLVDPYPDLIKLRCKKHENGELECV